LAAVMVVVEMDEGAVVVVVTVALVKKVWK
jgi:hypothetical protein